MGLPSVRQEPGILHAAGILPQSLTLAPLCGKSQFERGFAAPKPVTNIAGGTEVGW